MRFLNFYVRARRIVGRISKLVERLVGRKKTLYVWDRIPYYKKMWEAAAARNNLKFEALSNEVWELTATDGRRTRIHNCYVELDDPVTLYIAGDKTLTYALLSSDNLPVPPHAEFSIDDLTPLTLFVDRYPGPFVVKPASGTGSGLGVSTHLYTLRECLAGAALASLYGRKLLIEQFVAGEVYRLLFVEGRFVNAVRRRGVHVVGDGQSTLEQLIVKRYAAEPALGRYRGWSADIDLTATTAVQQLRRDTVPRSGDDVLVKSVAGDYSSNLEVRTVYTEDVTEEVAPELIEEGRRAAAALGSQFCGVDMIAMNCRQSLARTRGVIGEINTTPGLHHHYDLESSNRGDGVVDAVLTLLMSRKRSASLGSN